MAHRLANALQRIELDAGSRGATDGLTIAEGELRASLTDIQDIATALRPMAEEKSIESAVDELIRRLPENPPIRLESSGAPRRLLSSVNEELFAIVVEAVRNGRRHSLANEMVVTFRWTDAHLFLSIADDGRGFDSKAATASGLRSMKERAQIVGASLAVDSTAVGTSVDLVVPLGRVSVQEPSS